MAALTGEITGSERSPAQLISPRPGFSPTGSQAFACLLPLSLVYIIAEMVPGRFAVTDEAFFKAAGRNWAMAGRFAAPELTGFLRGGLPSAGSLLCLRHTRSVGGGDNPPAFLLPIPDSTAKPGGLQV